MKISGSFATSAPQSTRTMTQKRVAVKILMGKKAKKRVKRNKRN